MKKPRRLPPEGDGRWVWDRHRGWANICQALALATAASEASSFASRDLLWTACALVAALMLVVVTHLLREEADRKSRVERVRQRLLGAAKQNPWAFSIEPDGSAVFRGELHFERIPPEGF